MCRYRYHLKFYISPKNGLKSFSSTLHFHGLNAPKRTFVIIEILVHIATKREILSRGTFLMFSLIYTTREITDTLKILQTKRRKLDLSIKQRYLCGNRHSSTKHCEKVTSKQSAQHYETLQLIHGNGSMDLSIAVQPDNHSG